MLTKDDLAAIGELVHAEHTPLKEAIERIEKNMVTKIDLNANNRVLGTIVRTEIAAATHKLEGKIDKITKRLDAQDDTIESMKNDLHTSKN